MRNLIKNQKSYYVLNYIGKIAIIDSERNETGEYLIRYGDEQKFNAHISGAKGNVFVDVVGANIDYDKTIVMDIKTFNELCIDENSVFFIDRCPEYKENNQPKYDYTVSRISETLNEVTIAIKKVRDR